MENQISDPWFRNGLKFFCTGCGKCCTGSDGYVFLSSKDVDALAKQLNLSSAEFTQKYTRTVDGNLCLKDNLATDECIFLKNNRCTVYPSRPIQCQTFPWWIHQIESRETWNEAKKRCEGIEHPLATVVPVDTIAKQCMLYIDNMTE